MPRLTNAQKTAAIREVASEAFESLVDRGVVQMTDKDRMRQEDIELFLDVALPAIRGGVLLVERLRRRPSPP